MGVKLSPSRMNLYMECKRCFWLRVNQGVKRPSGPFPSLPSGVDGVIKEHFDRFRSNGGVPPEIEDADIDARLVDDQEFLEKARSWRTEPKWCDPETGAVLRGGVDDLLRSRDGKIIVLDYKTRGYPPKGENGAPPYYERQVNLYNLILRENGRDTEDFGLLLYYYPDHILENGDFLFHKEIRRVNVDIDAARQMVRDAVETLNGGIPAHDSDCEYCGWNAADHEC